MDLNLLVALDALIEHESVQGAAAAVHLTPPAMSHALRRLRQATGDDVLVRNGRAMVPTPRALHLRDEVRELVTRAESVLSPPRSLDLARLERNFTVRGNEALIAALAPPLLAEVAGAAPGVTLVFLGEQTVDGHDMARGVSDLEISGAAHPSPAIRSTTVGTDQLAVVMRAGHPLTALDALSIEHFAAAVHVVISRRGRLRGPIDEALAVHDLQRKVIAALPSTAVALEVVRNSDAITVVASRLVRGSDSFARRLLPLALEPLPAVVSWHRRHDSDLAHQWLRAQASSILAGLLD
ncbi:MULTISPECIES: LysR family transcriptional regulator [Subtercola]|uniref:LysR family transcriptional regulator n=1 Tax=Subtercola vilae TaxID=2056433 RepID=A0A4T2C997_9MICO|nr:MULTISPECIES: LysR family transcriptional regulator [Subtercola]MEA9984728.1 LysR family transcriptional regulator [Subtercola sp. RTI3]TIH39028.1 LysR family transcriptional regulator [Subtercola vilae]